MLLDKYSGCKKKKQKQRKYKMREHIRVIVYISTLVRI